MNSNEITIKHLEMIQSIISRMASNSFQFKSWAIVILSALLAIFANSANPLFILVATVPMAIFWVIDTFYLQQERKYRELYDRVAEGDATIKPFTMPLKECKGEKCKFWITFFSRTLIWLYGSSILFLTAAFLLIYHGIIHFDKISAQ